MRILFSSFNTTTKQYLNYLATDYQVFGLVDKREPNKYPQLFNLVEVNYLSYWFSYLFHHLKINIVNPELILNIGGLYSHIRPDKVIVFDFYHFVFAQFLRMRKKNSSHLYIWSETRRWPDFWLSRFIMVFFWWYFKNNLQYVEKVFVFSKDGERFFNIHAPDADVIVLPAPIEKTQFYPDVNKEYMPEGVLRIIMNARYIPLKEHKTFFKALQLLVQKGVKFHVSLIGRGGYLQAELKEYAKQLSIKQYITWLDQVAMEKLQKIYSSHDVLVLASNREAIGMVVPEAMACGLATVTSEAVGANTYVEEGKTGIIFKTGNATALAEALELLSKKEIVQAYGQAAAGVILKEYTVEVLGKKLLKALE